MNGGLPQPDPSRPELAAPIIARHIDSFIKRIDALDDWSRAQVTRNLEALGLDPAADVPLAAYLTRLEEAPIHPRAARARIRRDLYDL